VAVGAQHSTAIKLSSNMNSSTILWWFGVAFAAVNAQRRIALAAVEIAENLVVGAVLFDDVEDVFEDRGLAVPAPVRAAKAGSGAAAGGQRADRSVKRLLARTSGVCLSSCSAEGTGINETLPR